jgi:signal transduction histidine kinase
MVLFLMGLLGTSVTLQVRNALIEALQGHNQEHSVATARDLASRAADLILINDQYNLHKLLQDTKKSDIDISYAFILDKNCVILAHTFGAGFPVGLIGANECRGLEQDVTEGILTSEGMVWDTAAPILGGHAGTARVGISEAGMFEAVSNVTLKLTFTTIGVTLFGVGFAGLLTWIVTKPILSLESASQGVGRGDLSQRVEKWADDEIGSLTVAFNEMVEGLAHLDSVRHKHEKLQADLLDRVITAQEDERKRIARELHDEIGQALTRLMLGLRTLMESCPEPQVLTQAAELRKVASDTLKDVRNLAIELRPSALDDLGLVAALDQYIIDFGNHHDVLVDFAAPGLVEARLAPAIETALYRIVQESLTNIIRHSGASTASVTLEPYGDSIRAIVEDDGSGFDPSSVGGTGRHLGLYGMQERVELLNGSFFIESANGKGTTVVAEIPVELQRAVREPNIPDGNRDKEILEGSHD